MSNDKRIKEAFEQWEEERQKRIADFTLATIALLHGEAMTITQLKSSIDIIAAFETCIL